MADAAAQGWRIPRGTFVTPLPPPTRSITMLHYLPLSNRYDSLSTIHYSLSAIVLLVMLGCGTGEYERRLDNQISQLRNGSKSKDLYAPQELPKTPVSVRVPLMFKDSPLVEGAQVNGKLIDPRRVKPMLFPLPWLRLTYEGFIDDPEVGKLPCYCYLGAVDVAGGQARDFTANTLKELKTKPGANVVDWADFTGGTPDGHGNPWKKLRFTGPQEFFTIGKNNQEQFQTMPGVLEIYVHEEAGQYVLVAWRMPAKIEQTVELAKWAPLVAGSVSVKK
jgi:hypothetical protein